jgi:hypothetical protein
MERENDHLNGLGIIGSGLAPGEACSRPKPYVSVRELSNLTPWTQQAIRTMIAKGVLREGEHFFHVGRRPVFKWEAVVAFIERQSRGDRELIPHYRDRSADAKKTEKE